SRKGAGGVMQLMPDTARRYGVKDLDNPEQNIEGGVQYIADLHKRFKGDWSLIAAGYNAGEGAVQQHGNEVPPYRETLDYVERVTGPGEFDFPSPDSVSREAGRGRLVGHIGRNNQIPVYANDQPTAPAVTDPGFQFDFSSPETATDQTGGRYHTATGQRVLSPQEL